MSEGKTPRNLDQALAGWPMPERQRDVEWNAKAAPSARFAGVSDEELLEAPLPPGAAEGTAPTSTRDKDRAKLQLQELARLAERTPAPEPAKEKEENSGVVHLAALAASEGQNVDGTPLQATATSAQAAPPEERRAAKPQSRKEEGVGRPSWLMVGGLVAAAAVVALFFGMKHGASEAPVQVTVVAPAITVPAQAPTGTTASAATAKQEPADKAVDPSTLPQVETPPAATGAHAASAPVAAAAAPAKPASQPAAPAANPETAPAAANAPTPAASSSASLEALMQQAAGTPSTPAAPAATGESPAAAPGSVPLKPSQGAINGALGAALPGARGCLGPDDPISRATVTFQSDGTVQSVTVTGGAAGKPAEACIRSALMRAKVPAFAMPTFTAPATIRPN